MGVVYASFLADGKMFVINNVLNKPQRGAAMAGIDSFNRRSDILSCELAAGNLNKLIANLTLVSLIGLKEKAADGPTWDVSLLGALCSGCCSALIMLLTDEIKKELILLTENLESDCDEQGQAIVNRWCFPKPVHDVIVIQKILLHVEKDSGYVRFAPRITLMQ